MRLPAQLLQRKPNTHKGDYGHIFILAGSSRFSGAGVLASESAMRSGAGLVTLGIPKSINNAVIKIKLKEVMTLPLEETNEGTLSLKAYKTIEDFSKKIDVLLIGPGLTQNRSTQLLIRKVIRNIQKPMVIDADALNALVGYLELLKSNSQEKILTPHPGEFSRLIGKSTDYIQKNRKKLALEFSKRYNVIIVLKGHRTIVCSPESKIYINKTGNPGMATAGSGDVLAGIIASFLGQGLSGFESAKFAVYLHGLAADLSAKEKTQLGMIASDITEKLPEAIKICAGVAQR